MLEEILSKLKIEALKPMQLAALEAAKERRDIILLSPTGSGKTLGFLLPILNSLEKNKEGVQALIITPSRELALQIESVFKKMQTGYKINCCYGGHSTKIEKNNLLHPPAVLVGTPGRIAFHIKKENFDAGLPGVLVLDEFDKALEFGFHEDMAFIIQHLSGLKKRILTSATQMDEIPSFTGVKDSIKLDYLDPEKKEPAQLKIVSIRPDGSRDKMDALMALISKCRQKSMLIFCNHRDAVERISDVLWKKGIAHGTFHGKMEQEDRERALIKFRNGSHHILVTTDLASRGLDIPQVEVIIHYQLPLTEQSYIHRNGRTARMHASGTVYLILAGPDTVPSFVNCVPEEGKLPPRVILPSPPEWETLYIGAGKKDRINKVDIVGAILQKGKLKREDLGLIEVLDKASYAAIKRDKIENVVRLLKMEKIKGRKVRIDISR